MITTEELMEYLGVAEDKQSEVQSLFDSAVEDINRSSGKDWTAIEDNKVFCEAVRTQVYISYYGVRDYSKNLEFLREYLAGLITSLQLTHNEGDENGL